MKAIAIFTLVICCIGVESSPGSGVRKKRETTDCSFLFFPSGKRYQAFFKDFKDQEKLLETTGNFRQNYWMEARYACLKLGGDLAEPSTREEENKIIAAIGKFPESFQQIEKYWIGIEGKTERKDEDYYNNYVVVQQVVGGEIGGSGFFWVSGKKMEFDSGLMFANTSTWDKETWNHCGCIHLGGIDNCSCDSGQYGYVCEFANAAPICIE